MFNFKDKVVLVTGGSRGIGSEICRKFASLGATVLVNYNASSKSANDLVNELNEKNPANHKAVQFNVSDPGETSVAIENLIKEYKRLDILVANAGISIDGLLMRLNMDDANKLWSTNVMGSIIPAKAVIKQMMKQKHGRIIFMGSVVGDMGNVGQTMYSATKGAVASASKSIAREFANRGITVNIVAPGFIETDMTHEMSDEMKQYMLNQIPVGRIGSTEDIAAGVIYLASDEAGYVTGQTLRINGGLYME
jgi:3-oxoacyl-[acyl-carrier protein] reductase